MESSWRQEKSARTRLTQDCPGQDSDFVDYFHMYLILCSHDDACASQQDGPFRAAHTLIPGSRLLCVNNSAFYLFLVMRVENTPLTPDLPAGKGCCRPSCRLKPPFSEQASDGVCHSRLISSGGVITHPRVPPRRCCSSRQNRWR